MMRFGEALESMASLRAVRREGWPKPHAIFLLQPQGGAAPKWALGDGTGIIIPPAVFQIGDGNKLTPWTPTNDDLFATDWSEFER